MMTSLFDLPILLFIFTPVVLTIALVSLIAWWKSRSPHQRDTAEGLLAAAVQTMPSERAEWGRAMMAELQQLDGAWTRFWFALSCVRVALFPPTTADSSRSRLNPSRRIGAACGLLSVALPPLALPLLYVVALFADLLFHVHDKSSSYYMPAGLISASLLMTLTLLVSGLPLGVAGWYRRERHLWLCALGPCMSVLLLGYLWLFLYWFAVGPHGD
jgi:hypothetical protein